MTIDKNFIFSEDNKVRWVLIHRKLPNCKLLLPLCTYEIVYIDFVLNKKYLQNIPNGKACRTK